MASLNKVSLIGNLGRDPEMRYMPSGDAICNMAVATTDSWKDKATGEKKEDTEWHRVSIFGKLAEIAGQYLKKGSSVYLGGKLKTRKWTDKDGVEKYTTEIIADTMQMLGSKDAAGGHDNGPPARSGNGYQPSPTAQQQRRPAASGGASYDDDIPFRQLGSGRSFHAI